MLDDGEVKIVPGDLVCLSKERFVASGDLDYIIMWRDLDPMISNVRAGYLGVGELALVLSVASHNEWCFVITKNNVLGWVRCCDLSLVMESQT